MKSCWNFAAFFKISVDFLCANLESWIILKACHSRFPTAQVQESSSESDEQAKPGHHEGEFRRRSEEEEERWYRTGNH